MDFDNKLSDWKNEGVEPSKELQQDGFKAGYKPPASIFNWFWSKVSKAITELQGKLSSHVTQNGEEHTAFASSIAKKLDSTVYTSTDILNKIKEVDGAGSGLDADLLDGKNSTAFAESTHNHDDRYFTETEMGVKLNSKLNVTDFTGQAILDKLGGGVTGIDASTLEGHSASYFSQATHNHDSSYAGIGHNHAIVTSSANGFMNSTDKVKLDGIEVRANNYVHPDSVNTRHVSDTEKATWNAVGSKVDKVAGKDLSSNDFSTAEKTKLENLINYDDTSVKQSITQVASGVDALQTSKVDKITGKGLSSNDYTTVEKAKLADIADNANNYRHPSSHEADMIEESVSKRFVSDAEKAVWGGKADKTDIVAFNGTATLTNNVVAITVASGSKTSYSVTFTAPSNFNVADTYRINGVAVTLTDLNNEQVEDAWKSGSLVTINVAGNKAFFKLGGLPKGWNEKSSGEALEDIVKGSPIIQRVFGDYQTGISSLDTGISVVPGNDERFNIFTANTSNLFGICKTNGAWNTYLTMLKVDGINVTKMPNFDIMPDYFLKGADISCDDLYIVATQRTTYSANYKQLIYKKSGDAYIRADYADSGGASRPVFFNNANNKIVINRSGTICVGVITAQNYLQYNSGYGGGDPSNYNDFISISMNDMYVLHCLPTNFRILIIENDVIKTTSITVPNITGLNHQGSGFTKKGNFYFLKTDVTPYKVIKYEMNYATKIITRIEMTDDNVIPIPVAINNNHGYNRISVDDAEGYLAIEVYDNKIAIKKIVGNNLVSVPSPTTLPAGYDFGMEFSYQNDYLVAGEKVYKTEKKSVIMNTSYMNLSPLWWIPDGKLGYAKQSVTKGQQCAVNLFPTLEESK